MTDKQSVNTVLNDKGQVQAIILDSLKRIEEDLRDIRRENLSFVKESKLEREAIRDKVQRVELEFAVFKAKAMAYGGMAGTVTGIIGPIIMKLMES